MGQVLQDERLVPDEQSTLRALYDYWSRLRGDRRMPSRGDINPAEIPRLLPHVVLADVEAGSFRVRLAGTVVCERFGVELRGRSSADFDCGEASETVTDSLARVAATGNPVYEAIDIRLADYRHLRFSHLLLPLSEDGERVNMILAGVS